MNRRAASRILIRPLAFCLLLLAACGFHPVYGGHDSSGSPVAAQLNQVAIDNIPDQAGQMLRNNLIDQFYGQGRPAQPLYHLSIGVKTGEEFLGLLANATSTLSEVTSTGSYRLADTKGNVLVSGTARSVTDYDLFNNQYGTLAAKNSAIERNMTELSEQITNRLSLYFAEGPPPSDSTEQPAPVKP